MPIYEYRVKTGGALAVLQPAGKTYKTLAEVPKEYVLQITDDAVEAWDRDDSTRIERIPSAPGGFRGLPTPKFHGRS